MLSKLLQNGLFAVSKFQPFATKAFFSSRVQHQIVFTKNLPPAIGPYSQAVVVPAGLSTVYLSSLGGVDPQTGRIVSDEIDEQTEQALENLKTLLSAANSGLEHVVKVTVYLSDMTYFSTMNTIYNKYFPNNPPARSCIAVKEMPRGAKVAFDAIALTKPSEQLQRDS